MSFGKFLWWSLCASFLISLATVCVSFLLTGRPIPGTSK